MPPCAPPVWAKRLHSENVRRQIVKFIRIAWLLLAFVAAPAGTGEAAPIYALGINGLSCPFCAYGIEKELVSLDGVERLGIDIGEGLVTVHMAEGATLDETTARRATENAGFSLRSFEIISSD